MAYARWYWTDIYMWSSGTEIVCDNDGFRSASRTATLAHVEEHTAKGDDVGEAADRLREEIARVGDDVKTDPWVDPPA